jgi:hypothetical protein
MEAMVTLDEAKDIAIELLPRDHNREELHIAQDFGRTWGVQIEQYKYSWADAYEGKKEEVGVEFMFKAPRPGIKALIDRCCEMLYNEMRCIRVSVKITSSLDGDRAIVHAAGFVSNIFQTTGTTTNVKYYW